jgi:hypothetical protein
MTEDTKKPPLKDNSVSSLEKCFNKEPKKKSLNFLKKKRNNISLYKKYIKNPSINHFNLTSKFIFDIDEYENFFSKNSNKKLILVNEFEIQKLTEKINEIQMIKDEDKETNFIKLPESKLSIIKNYIRIKEINEPLTNFIKEEFLFSDKRNLLSCRKLSNLYYIKTGRKASRTTINTIIRERLGYRFLKTNPKVSNINDYDNILMSLTFIKIIIRSIILGFNILFCDESGLHTKNNNLYFWRKRDEMIYHELGNTKKKNLIMTVSKDENIYYEILDESTDSKNFLK